MAMHSTCWHCETIQGDLIHGCLMLVVSMQQGVAWRHCCFLLELANNLIASWIAAFFTLRFSIDLFWYCSTWFLRSVNEASCPSISHFWRHSQGRAGSFS
jgi:hypothetical protein